MQTMFAFIMHAEIMNNDNHDYIYTPTGFVFEISREDVMNDPRADHHDANGNPQPMTLWAYDDYWTAVNIYKQAKLDAQFANA